MNKTYITTALVFSASIALAHEPLTVTTTNGSATRGQSATVSCTPAGGCPPYTYEWTSWTKGDGTKKQTGSSASCVLLDTLSVTVTVKDDKGASVTGTATMTVTPRTWTVGHATTEDINPTWGTWPLSLLGRNENKHTSAALPIIGKTASGDWSAEVTRKQVNDTNGPFDTYWYNEDHALKVERVTLINQYLKGAVGTVNWVTYQNAFKAAPGGNTPVVDAAGILAGVKAHENQGLVAADFTTSPKKGGHSALFKKKQDVPGNAFNAGFLIESLYNTSENGLKSDDNSKISGADSALAGAGTDPLIGNLKTYIITNYNPTTGAATVVYTNQ